jgi:hypothetical protein
MPTPNPEADQQQQEQQTAAEQQQTQQETSEQPKPESPKLPEVHEEAAKEADKDEKQEEKSDGDLPFEPTGNEYIDEALGSLHEGGVDFEKAFGKFAESGNEADIDMAYIESVIGKAATYGIMAGVKAENQKIEQEAAATAKAVHEAAGGKEMWDGVCEWIASGKSGLTKEGWEQYNDMLASGGVQAELASRELSRMYQQSPGFTQPTNMLRGDATAQPSGIEPITRREYAEQLDKVVREKGENSHEAQVLHKRREFALQQGL